MYGRSGTYHHASVGQRRRLTNLGRTWNSPWSTPGGDFATIGSASLSPGTPVAIPAASAIQTMIDAGPSYQNILIRKTAPDNMATVNVSASVDVEFDLVD